MSSLSTGPGERVTMAELTLRTRAACYDTVRTTVIARVAGHVPLYTPTGVVRAF